MPVSSATSSPPLVNFSNLTAASTTARTPTQALGENDFLKLLSVQLQQQDPMKPMDDTSFIAQTAQFTSLQQMTQLNQQQQMMTGTGYIGRTVTVQNLDGTQVTGLVTALDNSGTTPALVINGTSYSLSSVKRIEAAATTAATGTTGSTSTGTTGATTPTAAEATPNPPDVAQTPTPSTTTVPSLKG